MTVTFHTGHVPDHHAIVACRLGLHLHHGIGAMRAVAQSLPLKTNNRAKLPVAQGGPGVLDQHDTETCEFHTHAAAITLYFALLGTSLPEVLSPVGLAYGGYTIDRPPPAADGTVLPLYDVGTMPSSVLSALSRWGACGASVWGQYPASRATMYKPGTTDAELIEPAPEKFLAESPFKLDGAFFVQSQGMQRRVDILSALAVGRPVSMAIPASGQTFGRYRGGVLRAVDLTGDVDHANYIVDYTWAGTQDQFDAWLAGANGFDSLLTLWCVNSWGAALWGASDISGIVGGLWQADVTALDNSIQDACVLAVTKVAA